MSLSLTGLQWAIRPSLAPSTPQDPHDRIEYSFFGLNCAGSKSNGAKIIIRIRHPKAAQFFLLSGD